MRLYKGEYRSRILGKGTEGKIGEMYVLCE